MIDGLPRSALVTESPALVHVLDADPVEKLRDGARGAYELLVLAIARLLSSRVGGANTLIQALQD